MDNMTARYYMKKGYTIRELSPMLNDRNKSYYRKAWELTKCVEGFPMEYLLISYETEVARITIIGGKQVFFKLWDGYSMTTMKHINTFRKCHCLKTLSKSEWEEMKEGVANV